MFENVKGRMLFRMMRFSCGVVCSNPTQPPECNNSHGVSVIHALRVSHCVRWWHKDGVPDFHHSYDAGVLGGIQDTEPFRHAMGVRSSNSLFLMKS